MRRNADRALVLAGHEPPRRGTGPVALVDVLRAASSEIEHYDRVTLSVQLEVFVAGSAATDTVHLLAELLENGTTFSPATSRVIVAADMPPGGDLVISVADAGPGMPEGKLRWLNWQLANPPLADGTLARHLGMFAVAHLAARHGITVELRLPPDGGVTAEARLPAALISAGAMQGGVEAVPDVLALGAPVPSADADAGLPRRTHRAQRVPGAAGGDGGGGETQHGPAADPALIARDRLASFQRGSRRAQADRGAAQPAQNR